ncbi:MAG: hypothetical protein JSW11_10335 [Candidatus Heimdallarchaeota archaeon]|nr:MAG: hypothetical protein JSW11_10335 [Candidatus Heimdallarchaeota archaeon]
MKYNIKTYQKEYLDDHARIEADERNRWGIIERPDKEQIKTNLVRRHSQQDFDPETQLYAFEEDRIVGVITSSIYEEDGVIKGDLRIPFVAEGYEDARDPLLERVIQVLKTKEVTWIRTMVSEYWGETVSVAKRNGFEFDKDVVIQSQKRFDAIDVKKLVEPKDVQNFDYQKHADAITKMLMKQYNTSEEETRTIVDRYKDWEIGETKNPSGSPQKLIAHGLILDKEEVVGRLLGFQQEQSGEKTTDLSMYAKDNDKEILSQLLAAGIRESKKQGMEVLHVGLRDPTEEIKGFYSSYGLIFKTAAAYYTKKI